MGSIISDPSLDPKFNIATLLFLKTSKHVQLVLCFIQFLNPGGCIACTIGAPCCVYIAHAVAPPSTCSGRGSLRPVD